MNFRNYCVNYCINYTPRGIPEFIMDNRTYENASMSLAQKVDIRALEPTFFTDINMLRGVEIEIPLDQMTPQTVSDNVLVYKIPSELRQGRSILSVLELSEKVYDRGGIGDPQLLGAQKNPDDIGNFTLNSMHQYTPTSTAQVEKLSHDEVIVYENLQMVLGKSLRVLLTYSENLIEIQPAYYPRLAEVGIHAFHSYLYMQGIIKVKQSSLYNGKELSIIESIIEDYRDSHQTYSELLYERAPKILRMTDERFMDRLLKMQISIGY